MSDRHAIQEAERLLAGITPGDWMWRQWPQSPSATVEERPAFEELFVPDPPNLDGGNSVLRGSCGYCGAARGNDSDAGISVRTSADAAFIAAAPRLVRELLADVQRKDELVGALMRRLDAEILRCDAAERRLRAADDPVCRCGHNYSLHWIQYGESRVQGGCHKCACGAFRGI